MLTGYDALVGHFRRYSLSSHRSYPILCDFVFHSGDAMKDSDDMHFSTEDRDNDECTCHCSQSAKGGWWYNSCALANLNGLYPEEGRTDSFRTAITWVPWHGWYYSLKDVEMKLRP